MALLLGAKTVNGPSPLRVSTNPANATSSASLDISGILHAPCTMDGNLSTKKLDLNYPQILKW